MNEAIQATPLIEKLSSTQQEYNNYQKPKNVELKVEKITIMNESPLGCKGGRSKTV